MASLKEFRWILVQDKTLKEYDELTNEGLRIDHDGRVAGSIPQNQIQQQQPLLMDTTVDDRIDQLMAGMFSKVLIASPHIPPTVPPPKVPVPVPVVNEAVVHTSAANEASNIAEMEVDPITPVAVVNTTNVDVAVAAVGVAVAHEADAVADTSTTDDDNPTTNDEKAKRKREKSLEKDRIQV
eukprot:CAMPEP_0170861002 /NCGR_PEP_ID=MMETSP0734-20130129/17891_1 /TAXON_ID=186038 /ORGANISM="Fragilariopsis kerguelensis, Strain L26-C5" /LENGTH=181 /DNA_ID=CAMNT_0011234873 /DNA_START=277 /DNA_END=820 /DNA_ORIENTATION=-